MQRSGWEDVLGKKKSRSLSPKAQRNWYDQGTESWCGQNRRPERSWWSEVGEVVNAGQEWESGFHSSLMEALKDGKQGRDLI